MYKFKRIVSFALCLVMLFYAFGVSSVSLANENEEPVDLLSEEEAQELKLPVIRITTDNKRPVTSKEKYTHANMTIETGDLFKDCVNYYTMEGGNGVNVRCRGNSSYGQMDISRSKKYSYKLKLDIKSDLFSMGSSKHWALIANFFDVTNVRNKLVYDFAGALGMTYNESTWCVLYFNGKYQGLYSLVETVRIGEGRVETTDWEDIAEDAAEKVIEGKKMQGTLADELYGIMTSDLSWITSGKVSYKSAVSGRTYSIKVSDYYDTSDFDITSGYLIEYDVRYDSNTTKYYTDYGIPIQLDSPKALSTNQEMYSYVQTLIRDFESAVFSDTFCTPDGRHWSEFVDLKAFVDYWLVFNFVKNIEFGALSIFFYIDDGKIVFGPCWDFDNASGNQVTLTEDWMKYDTWFESGRGIWWRELYSDPYFVELCKERWFEIKEAVYVYLDRIDLYYDYIYNEAVANYEKFGSPTNWYLGDRHTESFESEYEFFKNWTLERIKWLDEQFSKRDPDIDGIGLKSSEKISVTALHNSGEALEKDRLGSCDYYLSSSENEIILDVSTLHTSIVKADIFVNGKPYDQNVVFTMNDPMHIVIDLEKAGIKSGEEVVVFIAGYNSQSFYRGTYITVNYTGEMNPDESETVITVNGERIAVKTNSYYVFDEITEKREGFEALGYTNGGKTYLPGDKKQINNPERFDIKWSQKSLTGQFILEEEPKEEEPEEPSEQEDDIFKGKTVFDNSDKIRYAGVQEKGSDDLSLRFVSVIDSRSFDYVGYIIEVESASLGKIRETVYSQTVYSEFFGKDKSYSPLDYEGKYAVIGGISGLSANDRDLAVTVTPFAIYKDEVYYGNAYRIFYVMGAFRAQNQK